MISNILQEWMKIDVRMVSQIENAKNTGEHVRVYKSQIYEILENGELEITMPMEGGKIVLLSLGVRYEFVFYTKNGLYKSVGQVKERYKTENRYMLRIVLNTPLEKFQRREFYRWNCVIEMSYFDITKEQSELQDTEKIIESLRDADFYKKQKKGTIVDLSGGGIRFVSQEKNEDDSYILASTTLNIDKKEETFYLVGHIIKCIRADSEDVKYESRVEFHINDAKIREKIIRYIFTEERRARKHE